MRTVYLLKEIGYGSGRVGDMIFASKKDAKEWLEVNNYSNEYDIIEGTCYDSTDEAYQEKPEILIEQLSWRKARLKELPDFEGNSMPFGLISHGKDNIATLRNILLRGTAYFKRKGGNFSDGRNDYTEEEIKGAAKYYRQLCIEINNINHRLEEFFNSYNLDKAKYNITDDELKPLQYDEFDEFLFGDNYIDLE